MNTKLNCPICSSKKSSKFWAMPGYRLTRCLACNFVWDHMPPDNLTHQYEEHYFKNDNPKGGYANYFEGMSVNKKTFSDRLKKIAKKTKKKGRLLDVGCALGDCLEVAVSLGWQNPSGIELSKYACKFAKKRGLNVYQGTLSSINPKPASFDVVTMLDVIEHIPDPLIEMKRVKKVLRSDGYLFLVTPDIGGLWARLLGRFWYHYKPGEHIVYFSPKSIKKALELAGFRNILVSKTYHIMSLEYILNRLKYYSPSLFGFLLWLVGKTKLRDMPFRVYAGELEAWGQK